MTNLPRHARVVIIGGGAVGCSALYHLARAGWTDALVIEGNELTSGSTWHAAGNCPNFAGSWGLMKLQRYSTRLYAELGRRVEYPISYHVTGAVRLAHGRERLDELRHITGMARHQGIAFEMLSAAELKERYPLVELHDLAGAQWDPEDGDIDPAQLTQAFAKGARDLGARIVRFCPVTGIERLPRGLWRVLTREGAVDAEIVVNAAGYRAREIGAMVGRDIPCVAMSHQYLVTEDVPELALRGTKLPLLRDPDDSYYLRQERSGFLLGPYEWQARAHWQDGLPADFSFQLFPDDLERIEPQIEQACRRVPALAQAGIKKVINGPIPYTPDGNPLIGPAPGLRNFFECCVFSFGIVQAGGAGKTLADWVIEGEPEWDLWSCDPRRFTGYVTPPYVAAKAVELYQNEYAIGFPFEERPAGRPARHSPLYPSLAAKGALFGARNGWERAVRFPAAGEAAAELTLRRPAWQAEIAAECAAVAERVAIADLPGFTRLELAGPGAAAWLDGVIAGALPREGRLSLAYALTRRGGVLSEMTVTRLGPERFWLITASTAQWHDRDLLEQHRPPPGVGLTELTDDFTTLVLAGPRARAVLARLTPTALESAAFPWLAARPIEVAGRSVMALRVSYVGELGWELHVPMAEAAAVYAALWSAGATEGIADFGLYAIDGLRLEKCYRSWKQDLSTEYSALAAGLDRFVKLEKPGFPGRDALLAERERGGPRERLVPLLVDAGEADAPFCAAVFDGVEDGTAPIGLVTSGGWGHRIGRSIALAYVRAELARPGQALAVEIFGERRPAVVAEEPLYDPANARLRA